MDDDLRKLPAAVRIAPEDPGHRAENVSCPGGESCWWLVLSVWAGPHVGAVFADVGVSVLAILNASRMLKAG